MRVKIGDTWYNSDDQPICVELSEEEQRQIAYMDDSFPVKYAVIHKPCEWTLDESREWMIK